MVGIDRISELPEPILHHILSFLPLRLVAQTCVLSKTWHKTWRTYPILEFDRSILRRDVFFFSGDTVLSFEEKRKEIRRKKKKLLNLLEQTLRDRHCREVICMKRFKIEVFCFDDPLFISFVERCIFHAIGSNVKELMIEFTCGPQRWYNLPQIVFFAGSVELLKLKFCKLDSLLNIAQLSSLRKLYLSRAFVDDRVIENLVSGCPMIEDLNFAYCDGLKNLKLSGLSKLNEVTLTSNNELQRLNIEALNIHSLTIHWPSLLCEIKVTSCLNIRRMGLRSVGIKDEWLCKLVSRLPLLEDLSIWGCLQLRRVEISRPSIKKLLFSGCMDLVELKIDTPNLKSFTFSGDIKSISLNALGLSELELELPYKHFDTQWFVKYIELLAKFQYRSQVLILRSTGEKKMVVPRKLRQELPSPLSSVKHLNLRLEEMPISFEIANVLDGLLWISPHTETVSIEYGSHNKASFKFQLLYKKQLVYQGKFASCCNSSPILCWQQCIEEVNLEIGIKIQEKVTTVNVYTLKGADILEKIDALCRASDPYCFPIVEV